MSQLPFTKVVTGSSPGYLGPELNMLNRHGLIAGATGTGKTVTVKKFAELLSAEGVPSFLIDVKGDLNGFGTPGEAGSKFEQHIARFGENYPEFERFPVNHWDLYGEQGLPIRTTVSGLGPILLARLLEINEIQSSTLHALFQYADDNGLLLLDFKDLKSLVAYAGENPKEIPSSYGAINKASISAILRQLNALESQGVDEFFGERELDLFDLQQQRDGKGVINLLDATRLFLNPKMYSTFLLWLLSTLYEQFDEVGDADRPRMVFFFDEAHLIFEKIAPALLTQIEQVVRLIRSKGIGIYFISQSPTDLPDSVLSQLGNRVQHAMRAYTAKEIRNLKTAAQGYRLNPELDIESALLELGVGEALVSFLERDGVPGVTQRAFVMPPKSRMGKVEGVNRFENSMLNSKYRQAVDRESAYEILLRRVQRAEEQRLEEERQKSSAKVAASTAQPKARRGDDPLTKVSKSFVNSMTRQAGSMLARGLMGTLKKMF